MSARRPIDLWPPPKRRGRPGYSARHFASLAGAPNDPLRVAERCASRAIAEAVRAEMPAKIAELGTSAALDWQRTELVGRQASMWAMLCESLELVITVLEAERQTPDMKAVLREARRAARR